MEIWVSYANKDIDKLYTLKNEINRLSSEKLDVMYDDKLGLGKGSPLITKHILRADAHVILVSNHFKASDYRDTECSDILNAKKGRKRIFPFCLFDDNRNNEGDLLGQIMSMSNWRILCDLDSTKAGVERFRTWEGFVLELLAALDIKPEPSNRSLMNYKSEILDGRLVPFIGPECYSLHEARRPALPYLLARLTEIERKLRHPHDIQFARAVVKSRIPDLGAEQISPNDPPEFVDLRIAIVEAGSAASRIVGRSLSDGHGLMDSRYSNIKINAEDEDTRILQNALMAAKSIAVKLSRDDCLDGLDVSRPRMCIGARMMTSKLGLLYNCISPSAAMDENASADEPPPLPSLTMSQLDWLNDLLWHTMWYDLPVLPRTDELAFHLSLCHLSKRLLRVPLGTVGVVSPMSGQEAAEETCAEERRSVVGAQNGCTGLIYRHLYNLRSKDFPGESSDFYRAIARIICEKSSAHRDGNSDAPEPSLAVSVNLDVELERCLEEVEYSVIYPVQFEKGKEPCWMLRVHDPQKRKDKYRLIAQNIGSKTIYKPITARALPQKNLEQEKPKDMTFLGLLKGPLIVKLRGSPHHSLPDSDNNPPEWFGHKSISCQQSDKVENRVLLSSLEYTRQLSDLRLREPQCVRELFADEKLVFCYFGYPLDDPDGLFGIQRNVWVEELGNSTNSPKGKISVGCGRHDGLSGDFLGGLNVEPLKTELDEVVVEINNILSETDSPGSN